MKLQFDPKQEFQIDAVNAAVDLFDGQPLNKGDFQISFEGKGQGLFGSLEQTELGLGNSLVIEREHKLVALIYPDYDAAVKASVTKEQLPEMFKAYIHDLNHRMPKYIRIADFEIVSTEFEKTPKRSIKRFLYS